MTLNITDALAVYRLTRLITRDKLTASARGRVVRASYGSAGLLTEGVDEEMMLPMSDVEWAHMPLQDERAPGLATLVTCPWCMSVYVAFGVVLARRIAPRAWSPVARALAFSAVAGLASTIERLT